MAVINFNRFQSVCKYSAWAAEVPDDSRIYGKLCRKVHPPGGEYGKCEYSHCPYFARRIAYGRMYVDGEKVAEVQAILRK